MTRTFEIVRAPPGEPKGPLCFVCSTNRAPLEGYPNAVCRPCDETAQTLEGAPPWHSSDRILDPTKPPSYTDTKPDGTRVHVVNVDIMGDDGANPVFIKTIQCWRRYKFGGWITMADPEGHTTLRAFYAHHGFIPGLDDDCGFRSYERPGREVVDSWGLGFSNAQTIARMEGGEVFAAERDGKFCIITDERTMADFDPEVADLVRTPGVRTFDTREEREAYIRQRGWRP